MTRSRTTTLAALAALAIAAPALTGCWRDLPTEQGVVRLDVRAAAADEHGGRPFESALSTETFTEADGSAYTGDPDGTGTAWLTINVGQQEVCWKLQVANVAPLPARAAHIHKAPAGSSGGIVVGLSAPDASGMAAGCDAGYSRELLKDILQNPELYYVNVHTAEHPRGAVRGQLEK